MIRTRIYHKERNYSEDSVAYNRRRDGALKSIEVYELVDVYDPELDDEVDEFTLDQLYLFDRNERLIRFEDSDQWNDFDGYREMEILNFTYLKNKVITDVGYRTKRSEGFLLESYEYLNVSGFCKEISYSDDKDVPSYRVEKNLDTMVLFLSYNDKETRNASYLVENGRLVDVKQFNESNWLHIEYNEDNQPVHMIKRRKLKEGYSPAFETFIEYNVQGLPIKFTSDVQVGDQELNVPRPFEITWK